MAHLTPFAVPPGPLSLASAARLEELLQRALRPFRVDAPLSIEDDGINQRLSIDPSALPTSARVLLAEITNSGGTTPIKYSWRELTINGNTGAITAKNPGLAGTLNAIELYNRSVANGTYVILFPTDRNDAFWFDYDMLAAGSGTLTVEELDGSPTYSSIDTLIFDQTDGFVVSQPAAGQARVDIQSATPTQAGIVDIYTQHFFGDKDCQSQINARLGLHAGIVLGASDSFPSWATGWPLSLGEYTSGGSSVGPTVVFAYENFSVDHYTMATWGLLDNTSTVIAKVRLQEGGTLEVTGTDPKIKLNVTAGSTYTGGSATTGGLTFVGGIYVSGSFSGGSGTVTSVDCTVPSGFSVSGVPITGSGTIAISWNLTANRLLGSNGTGAFQQVTVAARLSYSAGSLDLATTGVSAGTYASVGVDVYGRVTSGSTTLDATNLHFSASSRIAGRKTAGAGAGEECTLSEVLDFIGSTAQGDLLYRDASAWGRLAAGTAGYILKTGGAGANPSWSAFAASQSDQELQTSNTVAVTPAVQQYHPSAAKAWAYVDGTGTASVLAGYNTTLTDNGTGDYTLVWGTDFSSANYAVLLTVNNTGSSEFTAVVDNAGTNQAAGSTRIWTITLAGALIDARFYAAAFGDQ